MLKSTSVFRVTYYESRYKLPELWWPISTSSAETAAKAYVANDYHDKDRDTEVVVLCPDGTRIRFVVETRFEVTHTARRIVE